MKKLYEAPEMEELLVVSERVMAPSTEISDNEDSDNEIDIGGIVRDLGISTP